MKQLILSFIAVILSVPAMSGQEACRYVEASDLTLTGKVMDTPNPYHRIDTCRCTGFSEGENFQARCASGLAVLFRTNSTCITVLPEYAEA